MIRRPALILLSVCLLALSALACNLPGISKQPEVTETFVAMTTATAIIESTIGAQLTSLSLTQTASIPTVTQTPSATATSAPSSTAASTDAATPAATGAATGPATKNANAPTQTSIANGTLKVGVEAIVRVTNNAQLNLRDAPGKNGKMITRLPADTRVKITDGPQLADGVLWWKIQILTSSATAAIDKTGWVAEFADAQTLEAAK